MQTAIIIINLILSAIGLVCIHLKTYTKEKHIVDAVKKVLVPGAVFGIVTSALVIRPITISNILTGLLLGVLCGETLYIFYLIAKGTWKEEKAVSYYDDGTPAKYFITGDKHRNFSYVKDFCRESRQYRVLPPFKSLPLRKQTYGIPFKHSPSHPTRAYKKTNGHPSWLG